MTAFRFSQVALASTAFSIVFFALPSRAAAGLEEGEVFAQEDGAVAGGRVDERRRANDGDWFRAPMQRQGPEDFPSNEVHDAVVANARAATARAVYRRVESDLHATVRSALRDFEQSAELRETIAAEQRAYDALVDARREALRDVLDDPKYQAMRDLREGLSRQIADRRDGVAPAAREARLVSLEPADARPLARGRDDVIAIASVKLRVGSDAAAMEREALADNDDVRRAKDDLVQAGARVSTLRNAFDRTLRTNDELKRVRDQLDEAKIARITAESYLQGASQAARAALDFSYYLHRYDYYRYNNADYGYGYRSNRSGYPFYGSTVLHRAR